VPTTTVPITNVKKTDEQKNNKDAITLQAENIVSEMNNDSNSFVNNTKKQFMFIKNKQKIKVKYFGAGTYTNTVDNDIKQTKFFDKDEVTSYIRDLLLQKYEVVDLGVKHKDFMSSNAVFDTTIPTTTVNDKINKPIKFDEYIINQSPKNLNYGLLSITDKSRYSSLMPWHIEQVKAIFTQETKEYDINVIVDANAHIGVDSILFRLMYPNAKITSIELDDTTYLQLEKNVKNLAAITNNKKVKPIKTLHMDCLDYIFDNTYDLLYFDPPWNDLEYKNKNIDDLYLSGRALSDIVNEVINLNECIVCIKLPANINLTTYKKKIYATYFHSHNIYTADKKDKISYVLVFIQ